MSVEHVEGKIRVLTFDLDDERTNDRDKLVKIKLRQKLTKEKGG